MSNKKISTTRSQISWQVELKVKPGKLEDFRRLTHEMTESTLSESGAIIFERFISPDGKTVYVNERYVDSDAAVAHLRIFKERFARRFSDMVERNKFIVFGNPSDDLKRVLDAFGAEYFKLFDGFSR